MFDKLPLIERILEACYLEDGFAEVFGMLYLVSYIFLLRVPSEAGFSRCPCQCLCKRPCFAQALPISRGGVGFAENGHLGQAVLYLEGRLLNVVLLRSLLNWVVSDNELCLKLKSRKNKPDGSFLKRGCWFCALILGHGGRSLYVLVWQVWAFPLLCVPGAHSLALLQRDGCGTQAIWWYQPCECP